MMDNYANGLPSDSENLQMLLRLLLAYGELQPSEPRLTDAQIRAAWVLANTENNSEALQALCVSPDTLRHHATEIIKRTGLDTKGVRGVSGLRSYLRGVLDSHRDHDQ